MDTSFFSLTVLFVSGDQCTLSDNKQRDRLLGLGLLMWKVSCTTEEQEGGNGGSLKKTN